MYCSDMFIVRVCILTKVWPTQHGYYLLFYFEDCVCIFRLWYKNSAEYFPVDMSQDLLSGSSWARLSAYFVFKLYPDNFVYYLVLSLLALVACLSHRSPALRCWIHARVRLGGGVWLSQYTSHGELCVAALVIALVVFWAVYWPYLMVWRLHFKFQDGQPQLWVAVMARTLGQVWDSGVK